jgi:hypothetical protein
MRQELLRLEVLMDYHVPLSNPLDTDAYGYAAVRWVALVEVERIKDRRTRQMMAAAVRTELEDLKPRRHDPLLQQSRRGTVGSQTTRVAP